MSPASAAGDPAARDPATDGQPPDHNWPPAATMARRLAEAGILVTVLIWSANFVLVKAAIGVLGPLAFAGARFSVAAVTLLAILRWRQGQVQPPAGQLRVLLALGAFGFGAYQILWSIGLTSISAGDSALIVAASPVLTALLAGAVGMDRLTLPKAAGALIAFAGVAIVIARGHDLTLGASLPGDLLTLAAASLWALYTVGGTRVLRRVDPLQATTWTVVGGLLVLAPLALFDGFERHWTGIGPEVLLAIVASGSLAAGVANVFVFNAIRFIGPTRATAMQLLVPAGAVLLGAAFLGEPVGVAQVVGGGVIVAGVWITRRASIVPRGRMPARLIPDRS